MSGVALRDLTGAALRRFDLGTTRNLTTSVCLHTLGKEVSTSIALSAIRTLLSGLTPATPEGLHRRECDTDERRLVRQALNPSLLRPPTAEPPSRRDADIRTPGICLHPEAFERILMSMAWLPG